MKKLTIRVLYLFFFLVGLLLLTQATLPTASKTTTSTSTSATTTVAQSKDELKETIKEMSVDEKIGSLLILGFRGTVPSEHIKTLIERYHVGGVNLLKWNITDAEQTKKLTADLQTLYKTKHTLPFIVAVDQEGGTVVRFKFLTELTAQTKIKTEADAKRVAEIRAKELSSLGINMNFAPVVDYITDKKSYLYNRTFATTTVGTITLGKIMADTYMQNGVMPVFKHFPGYGNSTVNPHTAATQFTGTKEMFNQNIEVFKSLLTEDTDIPVMTAHIVVPWVSSSPATKSKKFMTEILRDDFDYDGVVITDDLDMVSVGGDQGESAVDAILAGADMIISTPNDTNHLVVIDALKKAVNDGTISKERLDQSVYRVLKLRKNLTNK